MVEWGIEETIKESPTINIGGDTTTRAFYADDGQEKWE